MLILATGTSGTIGKHFSSHVSPISADLRNFNSVQTVLGKFQNKEKSSLIHLAGVVGKIEVEKDLDNSRKINILGTKSLAEHFKSNFSGKFYYVSTSHVYACSKVPIDEEFETSPSTLYASQKLEAENLLKDIFSDSPDRLCILRLFSVLDWDTAPFTLGGGIRKLADKNSDFELNYSNDIRDFLTPKTVAETILTLVKIDKASGIVNVCTNVGTPVIDACVRMLTESNFQIPNSRINSGTSDNPIIVGNNSKLLNILPNLEIGWKPSRISE